MDYQNYNYKINECLNDKIYKELNNQHVLIKSYYNLNDERDYKISNGTLLKYNDEIYCLTTLNTLLKDNADSNKMLLRSKNIEIINLINNININSIIDNNTNIYIDLIEYQSLKTNNKYLILLTHISIEIYMIYDLNLVHTKSYKFSNLFNRKFFTYNDKLFIISNNVINVFNLQDIDQNIII